MQISPIGYSPLPVDLAKKTITGPQSGDFAQSLSQAVQTVNDMQVKAEDLASQVALGGDVELHDAVLAGEEANMAFQYTLQVRNKLIEAYQEVMRMQV